jgi:Ca2+-binding RTX toxin-like protein
MATVIGNAGNNALNGTNDRDEIFGRAGDDGIQGFGANDRLHGEEGNDRVTGGDGNDLIWGDFHPEIQFTKSFGDDHIDGGNGNDRLDAGPGNDTILGGSGRDRLYGQDGDDVLDGGTDVDELYGGGGNDTLIFSPGSVDVDIDLPDLHRTVLNGGAGFDTLKVTNLTTTSEDAESPGFFHEPWLNSTIIYAGTNGGVSLTFEPGVFSDAGTGFNLQGIERIEVTGPEPLTYLGNIGDADITIVGTRQGDFFLGGDGDETFLGGGGNDTFQAGSGTDMLISWINDADSFYFQGSDTGHKEIQYFNGAGQPGGDHISISGVQQGSVSVTESNGSTVIDWGNGDVTIDTVGLSAGVDYDLIFIS